MVYLYNDKEISKTKFNNFLKWDFKELREAQGNEFTTMVKYAVNNDLYNGKKTKVYFDTYQIKEA